MELLKPTEAMFLINHEYAGFQTGRTIHSNAQMDDFGLCIDEKILKVGGSLSITTPDRYMIPPYIKNGLV